MSLFESLRLDGQIALVTGAGRGIGATIARYLAEAGAEVILLSRTLSELQTVAQQITESGGRRRFGIVMSLTRKRSEQLSMNCRAWIFW